MSNWQVVDIITQHPNHEIVVGIDTLGKEGLLLHISQALSTKVCLLPFMFLHASFLHMKSGASLHCNQEVLTQFHSLDILTYPKFHQSVELNIDKTMTAFSFSPHNSYMNVKN